MRHRIIQHKGRRYSLKLEQAVWLELDQIAALSGQRLNRLVAAVAADSAREGVSLTAVLRRRCLEHAQRQAVTLATAARDGHTGRGVPLGLIAEACPSPCAIVAQDHRVISVNTALEKWLGIETKSIVGKRIDDLFAFEKTISLDDIAARFGDGIATIHHLRAAIVRSGRMIVARASLCPAATDEANRLSYLIFFAERA
jgi:PAS domain S-box-containing protein